MEKKEKTDHVEYPNKVRHSHLFPCHSSCMHSTTKKYHLSLNLYRTVTCICLLTAKEEPQIKISLISISSLHVWITNKFVRKSLSIKDCCKSMSLEMRVYSRDLTYCRERKTAKKSDDRLYCSRRGSSGFAFTAASD